MPISCFTLGVMFVDDKQKEYLALYSGNCVGCKHLYEHGKVEHEDCHYSKGNTQCPAQEVQLVVVGEAVDMALRVLKARDRRQPIREAKIMKIVAAKSDAFKSKFYDALENGGKL